MGRIQQTGVWLFVLPSNVNGTALGAQEWRESLFLLYGINPPNLLSHCDYCGASLTIFHDLECNKGGLFTAHHNNLHDGVTDLSGKAFTPVHVRDDSKIFTGCAVRGGKAKAKGKETAKGKDAPPL